jgi:hypothetical protein
MEPWEYVANSGLIVAPAYRKSGCGKSYQEKESLILLKRKIS